MRTSSKKWVLSRVLTPCPRLTKVQQQMQSHMLTDIYAKAVTIRNLTTNWHNNLFFCLFYILHTENWH